jgi:hypothetical protein
VESGERGVIGEVVWCVVVCVGMVSVGGEERWRVIDVVEGN